MGKKCLLLCFSGTGNTLLVGRTIQEKLEKQGYEVTLYRYREPREKVPDPNAFDLIGFGYPIHAFNTPEAFLRFVSSLPVLKEEKDCFIFKVSGEPLALNNASSASLSHKLKKKHYVVKQEKHFLMPYNIIFRFPDGIVKSMLLYLEPLSTLFVQNIVKGKEERIPYPIGPRIVSWIFRIEWLAPKVNHLFFYSDKKCIHCHLCEKTCPMQAIYEDKRGRMRARRSCALCMNCTMVCPKDAIHFGFLNPWKVNGVYPYSKILSDKTIEPLDLKSFRHGFFHSYRSYFIKQERLLQEAGIPLPAIKEEKGDE